PLVAASAVGAFVWLVGCGTLYGEDEPEHKVVAAPPPPSVDAGANDQEARCPLVEKTIRLTSPVGSDGVWTVPLDWNPSYNKVECIGGGGGGTGGQNDNNTGGGGGGGGAYARSANLDLKPGSPITYRIGAAGKGGDPGPDARSAPGGGDTWFN